MARPLTADFLRTAEELQRKGYGRHFIQAQPELARGFERREDWALDYVDDVWQNTPEADELQIIDEQGAFLGSWRG